MKPCSICNRDDRAEIDRALVAGVPLRSLLPRHAGTSRSALDRHRKHIPPALTQARQASEVAEATSLLSRVEHLMSRCEAIYHAAMGSGELTGAAAAAREMHRCLELLGKLNGELQTAGRISITLATIQNLDVRSLTQEQVGALYDRVQGERIREVRRLTDVELEDTIRELLIGGGSVPETLVQKSLAPACPQTIEGR